MNLKLPPVDPSSALVVNAVLLGIGGLMTFVAGKPLPAPVPVEFSHDVSVWCDYLTGAWGAGIVVAVNFYLHGASSALPGPATK